MTSAHRSSDKESPQAESFESVFAELEGIVTALEREDVELEVALTRFERGIELVRMLRDRLDRAERRITELVGDTERDFLEDAR